MHPNNNIGGAMHPNNNIGGAHAPPAPPVPTPLTWLLALLTAQSMHSHITWLLTDQVTIFFSVITNTLLMYLVTATMLLLKQTKNKLNK